MAKKKQPTEAEQAVAEAYGVTDSFQPGQLVQAKRITVDKRKVLVIGDGPVSVRLHKGCSVVDAPWGDGKALKHSDFVITEETNPRKGKQQLVSLQRAVDIDYARVE